MSEQKEEGKLNFDDDVEETKASLIAIPTNSSTIKNAGTGESEDETHPHQKSKKLKMVIIFLCASILFGK